jgi:hypothetical protein
MRTEYRLWTKPPDGRWATAGQHDSVTAAMAAAGVSDPGMWRQVDDRHDVDHGGAEHTISPVRVPETDADRIELALNIAIEGGGIDGGHHKQWSLDQIVRMLTGDRYEQVITEYRDGEDGPDTYSWDEGIAP